MVEYCYVRATPGGVAARALNEIDAAARVTMDMFKVIDEHEPSLVPLVLTFNGMIKGFSVVPAFPEFVEKGRVRPYLVQEMAENFAARADELGDAGKIGTMIWQLQRGSGEKGLYASRDASSALDEVCGRFKYLSYDRNVVVRIVELARNERRTVEGDVREAVVKEGGCWHHPKARKLSGTWVVRLPKPAHAQVAKFNPPGCEEISVEQVMTLLKGAKFESVRDNRSDALDKLENLQVIPARASVKWLVRQAVAGIRARILAHA